MVMDWMRTVTDLALPSYVSTTHTNQRQIWPYLLT